MMFCQTGLVKKEYKYSFKRYLLEKLHLKKSFSSPKLVRTKDDGKMITRSVDEYLKQKRSCCSAT